ncbi:MAG: T9SS type A sorting domain-containing protein [Ignavibacteriae bacterium]|nr:T9SS type A sorting domain-containing protein [Ignavibacteriota bacterium]
MKKIITFLVILVVISNISISQDQWYRTNGPTGGPVNCVFEKSSSKIFIGTNAGVYKSVNSGSLFSPIGLYDNQIIKIVALNNMLFALDGNYLLFRTSDDGSTWKDITTTRMDGLLVFNGILFGMAPFEGVYKSTNNGENWTLLDNGLPVGGFQLASFGNYLYSFRSYAANVIYRSADNGNSWNVLNCDLPEFDGVNSFGSFNNLLFVNLVTSTGPMIYKSTNSGVNWIKINNCDPTNTVNSFVQSGSYLVASVNINGVYRSSDKGVNWSLANNGLSNLNSISLTKGASRIYASINDYFKTGALFQSSNNANSWSELKNGLTTANVTDMVLYNSNILAATTNGFYKSTNKGTNWSLSNTGLTSSSVNVLARKDNSSTVYAGTDNGLFVSNNFGSTWTLTSFDATNISAISISGVNIYAGVRNYGVFASSDNGITWTLTLNSLRITALASKGNYVYAGWRNTHGKPHGGVYASSDKGVTWTEADIPDAPVSSIGIFDNNYVIASSNGVYRSTNFGVNWSIVNSETIIGTPADLVTMGYGDVYVANSNGVAGSYDYGNTWELVSYGLLSKNCQVITGNMDLLLVSPPFFGVWKLPLSKNKLNLTLFKINSNSLSSDYGLHQNYPNPFNPVTKISFNIPQNYSGIVTLKVYDITGKEISSLVNNTINSNNGIFEISWDGSKFASGVYFYKLTAGNFTDIKKMILVK